MTDQIKFSFIAGTLGQTADRYMRAGYKEGMINHRQILRRMASYGIADGVELHYRGSETENDVADIIAALEEYGFMATFVNAWLYGERKWMFGSLTASDAETRKDALLVILKMIDYTRKIGGMGISLWLGQDGFDYVFQTDYRAQWGYLLNALNEICNYASDIKVALEPKPREPRNFLLVDNVSTALLICMETGKDNLGLTVDMGHVMYGRQSIAQSLDITMKYGRLFNVHVNDNYANWDDDMIVGSVHLMELLEALYILKKYHYNDWLSVDIFPYREDQFEAVAESIRYMESYLRIIERMGMDKIGKLVADGNVTETMKAFRKTIFD